MQFVVNSISKSMELWDHQTKEILGDFTINFDISPFDQWHINIDDDLIFCSDEFYLSNKDSIGIRKQIYSNLSVHNRDKLSKDELEFIGDSFGIAVCSKHDGNGMIYYQIFLKEKSFNDLFHQLNFSKVVEVFISIRDKDAVFGSEGFDFLEQYWTINSIEDKQLPIQKFSLRFPV